MVTPNVTFASRGTPPVPPRKPFNLSEDCLFCVLCRAKGEPEILSEFVITFRSDREFLHAKDGSGILDRELQKKTIFQLKIRNIFVNFQRKFNKI
uniref:Uncharacterized protein n=1 Tax=Romanomermis culicivorax TaxID=13658 RepID=A0A915KQT9_ROMCU